jgi:hypothetical protein
VVHFRPFLGNCRSRGSGRPSRVGLDQRGYFVRWRPISLPGSGVLVLQRSEAQQGEPVWMAFAGHQVPRALADALGKLAAHVAPMVDNWLRVSTGVGGGCYSGIEMMGKRSQIRCIS